MNKIKSKYIFETKPFPENVLVDKKLTEINFQILRSIGLPKWVAPHIYFGTFDEIYLPRIKDWSWIGDWSNSHMILGSKHEDYFVLGSSQDSAPIFLKPDDSAIYTFEEGGIKEVVINSDLTALLDILNAYAQMIEIALKTFTSNVLESKIIDKITMDKFKESFTITESIDFNESSFWYAEIIKWAIKG